MGFTSMLLLLSLLLLAGIGGVAYFNRKAIIATEKEDVAKIVTYLKAVENKAKNKAKNEINKVL